MHLFWERTTAKMNTDSRWNPKPKHGGLLHPSSPLRQWLMHLSFGPFRPRHLHSHQSFVSSHFYSCPLSDICCFLHYIIYSFFLILLSHSFITTNLRYLHVLHVFTISSLPFSPFSQSNLNSCNSINYIYILVINKFKSNYIKLIRIV